MSSLNFPDSLNATTVKKAFAKVSDPPKSVEVMCKALDLCKRSADKLDLSLLKDFSSASEKALATRVEMLTKLAEEPADKIEKIARDAEKAANAVRTDLAKRDPKKADKEVQAGMKVAQDVVVDSINYAKDLVRAVKFAKDDVAAQLAALRAQDKADDDDPEEGKERNLDEVAGRIANALKLARQTSGAKPMRFVIGVLKKDVFVYVAKAVSGSTQGKIKEWMNAGTQSVTFYKGELLFEEKAHTFVGINIPTGGFAVKIQKSLYALTNKRFKIRVRRPTGERDEAGGDDDADDDEDVFEAAAKDAAADQGRVRRLQDRLKKLGPQLAGVLDAKGRPAEDLKASLRNVDQLVAKHRYDDADRLINDIERDLLDAKAAAAREVTEAQQLFSKRLKAMQPSIAEFLEADDSSLDEDAKKKRKEASQCLTDVKAAGAKAKSKPSVEAFEEALDLLGTLATALDEFEDAAARAVAKEVEALDPKAAKEAAAAAKAKIEVQRKRLDKLAADAPAGAKSALDAARKALVDADKNKDAASADKLEKAVDELESAVDGGAGAAKSSADAKKKAEDRFKQGIGKLQDRIVQAKKANKGGRPIEELDKRVKAATQAMNDAAKSGSGTDLAAIDKACKAVEEQLKVIESAKAPA